MTIPGFRLKHAAVSNVGCVRKANEDSFVARPETELWAVADGMGGHDNGQWASTTIAQRLGAASLSGLFDSDVTAVAEAIHDANAVIFEASQANGKSMGSTVVALLLRAERFAVLWAGDSRVYLWRNSALIRLSRDHTQVQEMVDHGHLTPEEAVGHSMSHVLSRAVGVAAQLELDAIADEAQAGDVFLLCSDGLTGVATEAEIAAHLVGAEPNEAAERLVELCLSRGAPDNVTVVIVMCEQSTLLLLD